MNRRTFGFLVASSFAAAKRPAQGFAAPSPGVAAADAEGGAIFPYGTHVYRKPHLPLEQLRADFPLLKRLGFNMIKVQESWAIDEPREGEINLSTVAQVVADAHQNGLHVYFGVTMEQAPAWLWQKYPEANLVYETGQPHNDPTQYLLPADGKPGPCWHHPGARQAGIRFVEAVGREIGKYDNVLVWNVWQEIGFWPMRPGHWGFCYCANTLREFRSWLRGRYATLEQLNTAWQTRFGDWEEVDPPRLFPSVPSTIDWRYFMDDVYLFDALRWKAEALRRSDPQRRPILAHVGAPTIGSTAGWRYAEGLDIFGSSAYPAWQGFDHWDADHPAPGKPVPKSAGLHHELWEGVMMKFDYIRSASRQGEFWTAELQGGPISHSQNLGRVPDAADIRRWVLGVLAAGARGLCFWNHRSERVWQESYGFALLDGEGEHTPRADEAGRLAHAIAEHAELFARGECPRAPVAMVMNEDLWHLMENSEGDAGEHFVFTIRGLYKALWDEGIPVDFLEAGQISSAGRNYRALIQPFPLALDAPVIEAYREYVRSGGTLIAEATPGRMNRTGYGYAHEMAPGIEELFGAEHRRVVAIREPGDGARWTETDRTFGDSVEYRDLKGEGRFSAFQVFPAFHLQTLTPTTATPILRYGDEVAGCVNNFGKGRAWLIGTLLGHAVVGYNDPRNAKFLSALLAQAGVAPDKPGGLQRRRRVLGNRGAWFLFNTTEALIETELEFENAESVTDLLGGPLTISSGRVHVRVEPLNVRCLVLQT